MITRAVALEFRHLAEARWQRFSDFAFGFSSLVVAFFGGMALGAVMQGFPLTHDAGTVPTYVGGAFRFISPFSIWTGIASVITVTLGGVLFVRARFEHGEPIRQAGRAVEQCRFLSGARLCRDHDRVQHVDLSLGGA